MASITREIVVPADPEDVWDRVRDVGNAHRLFKGVLSDCRMKGETERIVTFANGMIIHERILDIDDTRRRVAYSAVGGRTTHHNASLQVLAAPDGGCRVVWTLDFLPAEVSAAIAGLVDAGTVAMQRTLTS